MVHVMYEASNKFLKSAAKSGAARATPAAPVPTALQCHGILHQFSVDVDVQANFETTNQFFL